MAETQNGGKKTLSYGIKHQTMKYNREVTQKTNHCQCIACTKVVENDCLR
jgi:hypothetical protein